VDPHPLEAELIPVELAPARRPSGGPAPRYDSESGILEVPILPGETWTDGFDLDALVVVDVAEDRAIANLDVLVPRDAWTVGLPVGRVARRAGASRARVAPEVLVTKSLVETPEVFVSEDGTRVQVLLPGRPGGVRAVPLTDHCDGLVVGAALVGFAISVGG
jgi:hypothetical protein